MAEYSSPHDGGEKMFEEDWSSLWATVQQAGVNPQSASALEVYTDNDGRQVKVRPGTAFIRGHNYRSDAIITKTIAPNTSASTRNDMVVLRFDRVAKKITVELLQGASNGNLPILGTTNDVYDVPLAKLVLPNGYLNVASANIVDLRPNAGPLELPPVPIPAPTWTTVGAGNGPSYLNSWVAGIDQPLSYTKDAMGFVHVRGHMRSGVAAQVFTLPTGFRPTATEDFPAYVPGGTQSSGLLLCQLTIQPAGGVFLGGSPSSPSACNVGAVTFYAG